MPTKIKFCGMTNLDDALFAAKLGVDAIGLIFFEASSRNIAVDIAKEIAGKMPASVAKVAVFVNPSREFVESVIAEVPLDSLQFHGDESPEFCASFSLPYYKAIHMKGNVTIENIMGKYSDALGFLLETFSSDAFGGTGQAFDWSQIPENLAGRIILAGGLTPDNVGAAILQVNPYAVDVVSGIEASKGKKDPVKMQAFVDAVKKVSDR